MKDLELDECVNCGAGLLSVSDICPQCGWPKAKPIEPVEEVTISSSTDEFTEESTDEPIEVEFVNRLSRPTGVRMLGLSFVVFGILLAVASIIFGVFVMYVVILDVMGILGGIGDPSLSIPISTGGVDESMISSLDALNEIPGMDVLIGSTMMLTTSGSMIDFEMMATILIQVGIVAAAGVAIGLIYFVFGRGLLKGSKWIRYMLITSSIISLPILLFVSEFNLMVMGSVVFSGFLLYYLFKPNVRAYFSQPSIKNANKSKSKNSKKNEIMS